MATTPKPAVAAAASVHIKGQPAAPGIAIGPLIVLDLPLPDSLETASAGKTPEAEKTALEAALQAAVESLTVLLERLSEEEAGIVEFQIAMLEDDELRDPAFAMIRDGGSAARAWALQLDAQIADYAAAEDAYFRARTADLQDIKDRVLGFLSGAAPPDSLPAGAVLAGRDITPSRFLETDWSSGGAIALSQGSRSSHVAMLARARAVLMVVGLGQVNFETHAEAIVDGSSGEVVLGPVAQDRKAFERRQAALTAQAAAAARFLDKPAATADGQRIQVMVNLAALEDLDRLDPNHCDGVGLMRSEFLFGDGTHLPNEEEQYSTYRSFLEWAGAKPVTIRTLDAGGDKPVRGVTFDGESNPFLGVRGIRLSLARPEVFRVQLRALARAAVHGNLKVMWPMITVPQELDAAAAAMDAAIAELQAEGQDCARPALGMMVEVPSVAITPELFAEAAFFSIGSNDLTQYVTASARDNAAVAELNDPTNPAVLKLIAEVARAGAAMDKEVSLCGDMAGEPGLVPSLLKAGLRVLSVSPGTLAATKAAVAEVTLGGDDAAA